MELTSSSKHFKMMDVRATGYLVILSYLGTLLCFSLAQGFFPPSEMSVNIPARMPTQVLRT